MKTVSRPYVDSSSFKMALLFTALLTAAAAILFYLLIDVGRRDYLRETKAVIDLEIRMFSQLKNSEAALSSYLESRAASDELMQFRYEDPAGILLAGSLPQIPGPLSDAVFNLSLATAEGEQAFAARIHTFEDGSRIIVARNVHDLLASHERRQRLSWLVMSLMLAVVIASFGISHFVVSRINRIAATSRQIVETGDLSQRLSIDSRWDDLSNLSEVLNGFLSKIEALMSGVRDVSNNIAHDLRTPLSRLRNDIESLKGHVVGDEDIDMLLLEADHILAVFHALLRITNIERGKRSQFMGAVNLGKVLRDVAELYEPLAEEGDIRFDLAIAHDLPVKGDSDLLFQLFANVLDNAIKFSTEGSAVLLRAGLDNNRPTVSIEDQGPGIPDEEKEKVFQHFYRSDASREKPGNGLGLSLVRAVADLHQATLVLEDNHPGLRLRITFQPYQ